jgi:uncharacterized protein
MESWRSTGTRSVFHYGDGRFRDLRYSLVEDALKYEDFPDFRQPGLILHGRLDPVVPAAYSQKFAAVHPAVRLKLLDSGHELTDVLDILWSETAEFLGLAAKIGAYKNP